MAKIALAQKPFEVAIGRFLDALAAQRGLLLPVPLTIRLMALQAVAAVQQGPGGNRVGPAGKRIGTSMIPGWNLGPPLGGKRRDGEGRARSKRQNRTPNARAFG